MSLQTIFGKDKNIVIGAVHFPPLPGFPDFPGMTIAIENALRDAKAFEEGGVDGIIFENNYDVPHTEKVGMEVVAAMSVIGAEIKRHSRLPIGVSVLWNDYQAALGIAKALDLSFIRVPVFVDSVRTNYGDIHGDASDVLAFRRHIGAEGVALFTDIHVKHAELLKPEPIIAAANRAVEAGADALIVTGSWTGDAPLISELRDVREAVQDFPILCGSGVDATNVAELFEQANGAIVSTALKEETSEEHAANVKPYDARISFEKTKQLVAAI